MSTSNFPNAVDDLPDPIGSSSPAGDASHPPHHVEHEMANDSITAIQTFMRSGAPYQVSVSGTGGTPAMTTLDPYVNPHGHTIPRTQIAGSRYGKHYGGGAVATSVAPSNTYKACVAFEQRGVPGVIDYIWHTGLAPANEYDAFEQNGRIRIFLDNETVPSVDLSLNDFFMYAEQNDVFDAAVVGRVWRNGSNVVGFPGQNTYPTTYATLATTTNGTTVSGSVVAGISGWNTSDTVSYYQSNPASGAKRYVFLPFQSYARVEFINNTALSGATSYGDYFQVHCVELNTALSGYAQTYKVYTADTLESSLVPPATDLGGYASRTVTDITTNGTTTIVSGGTANFVTQDIGRGVSGTNIAPGTYIAAWVSSTTVKLSHPATGSTASTGVLQIGPGGVNPMQNVPGPVTVCDITGAGQLESVWWASQTNTASSWQASQAVPVGYQIWVPANNAFYQVITAGTTGSTQPTWPFSTTVGSITATGTDTITAGSASFTASMVGALVTGANVPSAYPTYVTAYNSTTSISLSQPVTTGTGLSVTIGPFGNTVTDGTAVWMCLGYANNALLEGPWQIYVDGALYMSTGGEDMMDGSFGNVSIGGQPAGQGGMNGIQGAFTWYKFFYRQPLVFNSSLKVIWNVGAHGRGSWNLSQIPAAGFAGVWLKTPPTPVYKKILGVTQGYNTNTTPYVEDTFTGMTAAQALNARSAPANGQVVAASAWTANPNWTSDGNGHVQIPASNGDAAANFQLPTSLGTDYCVEADIAMIQPSASGSLGTTAYMSPQQLTLPAAAGAYAALGSPATPFAVQVDDEIMTITAAANTAGNWTIGARNSNPYPLAPYPHMHNVGATITLMKIFEGGLAARRSSLSGGYADGVMLRIFRGSNYSWSVLANEGGSGNTMGSFIIDRAIFNLANVYLTLGLLCVGNSITAYMKYPGDTYGQPICRWNTTSGASGNMVVGLDVFPDAYDQYYTTTGSGSTLAVGGTLFTAPSSLLANSYMSVDGVRVYQVTS